MRAKDIKHSWRRWEKAGDNTDANYDIPLSESIIDKTNLTPVVSNIINTADEDFGPAMSFSDAVKWLKS